MTQTQHLERAIWCIIYLLFAIYLNVIDSMADGVKGALTGIPNFL